MEGKEQCILRRVVDRQTRGQLGIYSMCGVGVGAVVAGATAVRLLVLLRRERVLLHLFTRGRHLCSKLELP